MIRLAVAGAVGRMGRCVLELAKRDDRFAVVAALTKPGCAMVGRQLPVGDGVTVSETLDTDADVLIDFTVADATKAWLNICRERKIPMVIGSTGHSDAQLAEINTAANQMPILMASNFSVGIQALAKIVGTLAAELGEAYDIELIETHHRHKIDAPSGTALMLLDEIAKATGRSRETSAVYGRHGRTGARPAGQIGVHSVRMGEIIGQHEIHISGPGETITIRHSAHSRDAFAHGALRGAAWLVGRQAGLYSMRDVVG